uniref:Squalene/phytoene synthase family protein n=1 Tax=Phenylobacterium glaciei TaxID=2803784 RepID=A0A974S928_9CAUL|nr:squalene/phytoene synthase family protein [Phenylobacterium glaciei]
MSEDDAHDPNDLDALVGRVDPDRWLSSRFISDAQARADVIALYAFDHELARAPRVASNPLMGEIRLTWWNEVLDEVFEGARCASIPRRSRSPPPSAATACSGPAWRR